MVVHTKYMSGAVVGGVRDTSAGFYNPGALGFVTGSSFSVSANGYQIEQFTVEDGAGTGDDLESRQPNVIPLLVSGTFTLGGNRFGYSFITKHSSSINMYARKEGAFDILDSNPTLSKEFGAAFEGPEDYRGQYIYNSNLSEYWGGLSWANQLHKNISVGISGFLALRTQNRDVTALAWATNLAASRFMVGTEDLLRHVDYYNVRGLLKLGIAADFDALKLGATLTTPSVNLFGKGTTAQSFLTTKSDEMLPSPTIAYNTITDDRQENLDAEYKTPLSIAVGLEYMIVPTTRVAGTIEWFAEQALYQVMTPEPKEMLVGRSSDKIAVNSQNYLKVEDAADDVVNFAIAVEQAFNNQYKGYLSFRTDFSTFNLNQEETAYISNNLDIYHTTIGITRKSKESELAVGLTYSFGHQDHLLRPVNLDPLSAKSETDFLFTSPGETSAKYHALGVIVGYTYFFK